jgi:hypothetical protein
MANKRFFHINKGIALISCVIMIAALACVPKAVKETPKERPATLVISPASAKEKTPIIIRGSQFLPNEEVEVTMTVGDIYHGLGTEKTDVIVADKNGAFEVSSGIPIKTPPGTYKIEAVGNKGSIGVFNITVVK